MKRITRIAITTIILLGISLALNVAATTVLDNAQGMPAELVIAAHNHSCGLLFAGDDQKCSRCDGTKKCSVCWGSGENTSGEDCSICKGTGKCYYCNGTGKS